MILVDKPYLSEFLKQTSLKNNIAIIDTPAARDFQLNENDQSISEKECIALFQADPERRIYTNSENAIAWITKNLSFTGLVEKIEVFKNKTKFRKLTQPMIPDFYFQEIALKDLDTLQMDSIPFPFIIKPNVGFFSLGVHKVTSLKEWLRVKELIRKEVIQEHALYPSEVLNTSTFIIEENIEGEEFAFDAYFDEKGSPVILGIFKHLFSSEKDVSDRIYITSKAIIEENLLDLGNWLRKVGDLAQMRNFPVHVEIRRTAQGKIVPIEVNPLRFGGWCTTADMTAAAYGFNPYLYYFKNKIPAWDKILSDREGRLYSLVVLDNSSGYDAKEIKGFYYDELLAGFERVLELRKIDYREYPVFGFLFLETSEDNFQELERILKSDLREYVAV